MVQMPSALFIESFDRLTRTITGANSPLAFIRSQYELHPDWVNNPRLLTRCYEDALNSVDWNWPWFDEWCVHFSAIGVAPRMWQKQRGNKKAPNRAFLLCHSVTMACRRKNFDLTGLVRFISVGDEAEAIEQLIGDYIRGYCDGVEPLLFPPFFPGDRTNAISGIEFRDQPDRNVHNCLWRGYGCSSYS